MTGKDMLQKIQHLDDDLIEEGEFGTFREKGRGSRKKTLLILLAAALILGTLTGAGVYTRWSDTMQFGNIGGAQPSEQIKKQAKESGLSVIPKETEGQEQESISVTDQGITVSLAQTVMDKNGGKMIFRIEGFDLPEGEAPWTWWDYRLDGKDVSWGGSAGFYNGVALDDAGNPVYAKNGKPIPREGENQALVLDYQDNDGSIEYYINFSFPETDGRYFGKEMAVTFTGFGIQGERFEDEDIMTVPGTWELRWTLEGSTEEPRKWSPNAKIGHWDVTLLEAEIGQYSMTTTYKLDEKYEDSNDFSKRNGWSITPAGVRLKDGTDVEVWGGGGDLWDAQSHTLTVKERALNVILDPSQIVGMYFYNGDGYALEDYHLDDQDHFCYIPFE